MRTIETFREQISELVAEFWAEGHDGRDLVDALVDQAIAEGAAENDNQVIVRCMKRGFSAK